jgi:hypothetical protein
VAAAEPGSRTVQDVFQGVITRAYPDRELSLILGPEVIVDKYDETAGPDRVTLSTEDSRYAVRFWCFGSNYSNEGDAEDELVVDFKLDQSVAPRMPLFRLPILAARGVARRSEKMSDCLSDIRTIRQAAGIQKRVSLHLEDPEYSHPKWFFKLDAKDVWGTPINEKEFQQMDLSIDGKSAFN